MPHSTTWRSTCFLVFLFVTPLLSMGTSTVRAQIVLPTSGTIPPEPVTRSLLLGDDVAQVQAWWASPVDSFQSTWKSNIESRANQALGGEPTTYSESVAHSATGQSAAFRWAMTGDTADLDKAVDCLTHLKVVASDNYLTRSELTANYLCAYDFIRAADIDPNDRATIEGKLLDAAVAIGDWSIFQQENNHLAKRAATRAMAGVLLRDQSLLDNGLLRLNQSFDKTTTDDGWYTDSQGHYLNYIHAHVIPFVRVYHIGSGVNLWPNIEPFVHMTLGMRLPNGRTPNVQDGLFNTTSVNLYSRGVDDGLKRALIYHFTVGDSPVWSNVLNSDGTYVDFFWSNDFGQGSAAPTMSPTLLSPGQACVTVFRNDWTPDSDYLMLSAGIDGKPLILGIPIGHNHRDTGEIILFTHGEVVFPAAGYKRTDWSNWPSGFDSKLAENHNVILVNGSIGDGSQTRPEDFVYTNRLDSTERGNFKGVCDFATLAYSYEGANIRRSVAFPNEDYFVVADVIESASSNDYDFNLIGRGMLTTLVDSPNVMKVQWEIGEAQAIETLVSTHDMTLSTDSTYMASEWNNVEVTQRMQARVTAANAGYLSIIETGASGSTPGLEITELSTADYCAARVVDLNAGTDDLILSQSTPTTQTVDGITTDGQSVYVRRMGGLVDSLMISGGHTIAVAGEAILDASEPLALSLLFAEETVAGTISADGLTPDTELRLYGIGRIESATLGRQGIPFENHSGYGSVILAEGGELVITIAPAIRYTLALTLVNKIWGSVQLDPEPDDPQNIQFPEGTMLTLTAAPIEGRAFRHWEIHDENYPGDANYAIIDSNLVTTIVMDTDREVTAVFKCGSGVEQTLPLLVIGVASCAFAARRMRRRTRQSRQAWARTGREV